MARKPSRGPTERELEILQVLWQDGTRSVREVHERLSKTEAVSFATVQTMLQVMFDKDSTHRELLGRSYVHRAATSSARPRRSRRQRSRPAIRPGWPPRPPKGPPPRPRGGRCSSSAGCSPRTTCAAPAFACRSSRHGFGCSARGSASAGACGFGARSVSTRPASSDGGSPRACCRPVRCPQQLESILAHEHACDDLALQATGAYGTGTWTRERGSTSSDPRHQWNPTAGQMLAWERDGAVFVLDTDAPEVASGSGVGLDDLLTAALALVAGEATWVAPTATVRHPDDTTRDLRIDPQTASTTAFDQSPDRYVSTIGLPGNRRYRVDLGARTPDPATRWPVAKLEQLAQAAAHGLVDQGQLEVALHHDLVQAQPSADEVASFAYAIDHLDDEPGRRYLHELL